MSILVGKAYWKSGALPAFLMGAGLFNFTKKEISDLQIVENRVYRVILGAPSYVPVATLRGEIGSSTMESRMIKDRLLLAKNLMESKNGLVRTIFRKVIEEGEHNTWNKKTEEYLELMGMEYENLRDMTKRAIKERVRQYDTIMWKRELAEKSSIGMYRSFKGKLREADCYGNTEASKILFRARTNSMELNDKYRHDKGEIRRSTTCRICKVEMEDLTHFILRCEGLERRRTEIVRELEGRCERETLGKMLFEGERVVEVGEMIYEMWKERRSKIVREELKEKNELRQIRR